jgi:hypothetical protein
MATDMSVCAPQEDRVGSSTSASAVRAFNSGERSRCVY